MLTQFCYFLFLRYYVCDLHFVPEDHSCVTLKRTAVPSLHLNTPNKEINQRNKNAEIFDFKDDEEVLILNNERQNLNLETEVNIEIQKEIGSDKIVKRNSKDENVNLNLENEIESANESQQMKELLTFDKSFLCNCKNVYNKNDICEDCLKRIQTLEKYRKIVNDRDNSIVKLKKTIQKLRIRSIFHIKRNRQLKISFKMKLILNNYINKLKNINENSKTLAKILLNKKSRFCETEKNLIQNIFYKSPGTYRFMRNTLQIHLPSKSSIKSWTKIKFIEPGLNAEILNHLKTKIKNMSENSKVVVFLFDEMSIRKDPCYNTKRDCIDGVEDVDGIRQQEFATEAHFFMIRGLYENYKYACGYNLSKNNLKGENLKTILIKYINELTRIGFKIIATVCDQCSTNRNTYDLLGVSKNEPFFYDMNGNKIYALFDMPHLIKSIRNSFIKNDFENWKNEIVSCDVIKKIVAQDEKCSSKILPKIGSTHISPNTFQKMSVKLAFQLFSHSTYAAIKATNTTNPSFFDSSSNKVLPTADFILRLNNLIDSLNSSNLKTKNVYKQPIKLKNIPFVFLEEMIDYLKKLKCKNSKKIFCIDGLVQTITAVLSLCEAEIDNVKIYFIMTRRLNQDPLENMFSHIRSAGGYCRNPSAQQIGNIFAKMVSVKFIYDTTNSSNCEADHDKYLDIDVEALADEHDETVENRQQIDEDVLIESHTIEKENMITSTSENIQSDENLNNFEQLAIRYFAGFCTRSVLKCPSCKNSLLKDNQVKTSHSENLIIAKNYSIYANDFGSLLAPTDEYFEISFKWFKIFENFFYKNFHILNLKKTIVNLCIENTKEYMKKFEEGHKDHILKVLNQFIVILIKFSCKKKAAKMENLHKEKKINKMHHKKSNKNVQKLLLL